MATSKGKRKDRTGSDTTDEETQAQRRGKNEPGRYTQREEAMESGPAAVVADSASAPSTSTPSGRMETAFNDEDMIDDEILDYDTDEGDGDIDWDDSVPPRGGGKRADE